ncbi:MAG: hypothetical protein ACJ74Q_15945 [Pyrinomonadaceae bacterium]
MSTKQPPERVAHNPELLSLWNLNRARTEHLLKQLRRAMFYPLAIALSSAAAVAVMLYYAAPALDGALNELL